MKFRAGQLWWLLLFLILLASVLAILSADTTSSAQRSLNATRAALRQQGFKTDLSDFDLSTSPETRARENVLKATALDYTSPQFDTDPDLMEPLADNSVVVVWKQAALKRQFISWPDNGENLAWDDYRQAINTNRPQVDAACAAILSGPIGFNLDASAGNSLLLPHLATLQKMTVLLDNRTILALHDGDTAGAWTNLLAATRLVTAWNPEPAEVSHVVRFGDTKLVFAATWQALQSRDWTADQLARLQQEWTSADFFSGLPETVAFQRAAGVKMFEDPGPPPPALFPPASVFFHEAFRNPSEVWQELRHTWLQIEYFRFGHFEEEKHWLLFYRNRELEMRTALAAPSWAAMRSLPGVTNQLPFVAHYPSRISTMLNLRAISRAFQLGGISFLGHAAEAETERRILVTALALERYHAKSGAYPDNLQALAPEFLKTVPLDFMDGQPLRYRRDGHDHFLLYSVGLDGGDNGGRVPYTGENEFPLRHPSASSRSPSDIVWPLPATATAVAALRQKEFAPQQRKADAIADEQAADQWQSTDRHQAGAEELLAATALNPPDPNIQGRPLSAWLNHSGTNHLTLGQRLTLRQVTTGAEPETITFELPLNYDTVTNLGELFLCVDTNNDESDQGSRAQQFDVERAGNGDCLLVWSTLYESPGKHAVQAAWSLNDPSAGIDEVDGPFTPFVITNLCQFSLGSAFFDRQAGATFRARLPEADGSYTVELKTPDGTLLKTITGGTSNGVIKVHWNLMDEHGRLCTNDDFNSVFHIHLPASGRSQTLNGP